MQLGGGQFERKVAVWSKLYLSATRKFAVANPAANYVRYVPDTVSSTGSSKHTRILNMV